MAPRISLCPGLAGTSRACVHSYKCHQILCGISGLKREVYFYVWKSGTDATGNIQSFEPARKRKNTSAAKK